MANNVGVEVRRTTVGPLAFGPDTGDSVCIAVLAERGPTNVPVLVTSFDEYERIFGSSLTIDTSGAQAIPDAWHVLRLLFSKGRASKRVWVVRITSAEDVAAHGDLAWLVEEGSPPKPVASVHARSVGTWGNAIQIDCQMYNDSGQSWLTLLVIEAGRVVETYARLSLKDRAWAEAINNSSSRIQLKLDVSWEDDTTFETQSVELHLADGVSLSPNVQDVLGDSSDLEMTGLQAFRDPRLGRGWLIAPGLEFLTDDEQPGGMLAIQSEMLSIAEEFHRLVLLSLPPGIPVNALYLQHAEFLERSPFLLAYWPNVVLNGGRAVSPVGHVLADWMEALIQKGPGKAPAGRDFKIDRVQGVETNASGQPVINKTTAEMLVSIGINPIWDPTGEGPRVMGARTRSEDPAWKYAHTTYLYNRIASRVHIALTREVYEVADAVWFAQVRAGIYAELVELHRAGAFDGIVPLANEEENSDIHAFGVRVDVDLLSSTDRENGIVRAKVWFKEAGTAETILVDIAKRVRG